MHEFAEEYVANLKPREERYDTRLGDDFYVSTFPNGVKTWIYLYDVNGFSRRQTLGIFPEMALESALESLYVARRTRSVEKELMEQGLDGSSMVREAEDSPIQLDTRQAKARRLKLPLPDYRYLVGGACGALLAAGLAFISSHGTSEPQPLAEQHESPIGAAEPQLAETQTPAAEPETPVVAAAVIAEADAAAPAETGATTPAVEPEPVVLSDSQLEVIEMQQAMTGTLAWSQLTSGIVRGEPVDNLGWIVEVAHKPKRVFFFIRVRGMAGSTVTYHWTYEGEVVKRDAVRVGDGWHSPAFSSVILDSGREGQWQVEVFDQRGASLGVEQFETRVEPTAVFSRR